MKKHFFTLSFALCAAFGYSQTQTNIFPTTGNAGVGTTNPATKLDVILTTSVADVTTDLSFIGYSKLSAKTGIFIQDVNRNTSPNSLGRSTKMLSVTGTPTTHAGYLEFNAPATTNTTRSAFVFGYNDIESVRINQDGKVRIGSNDRITPAGYRLFVEEGILTEKVKVAVSTTTNWADFVFAEDYKLMPLNEVAQFTKEKKHLPNVPSAKEMTENGLDVAQMDAKLLEKVEELTLYLIEQQKQIESLKTEIKALKSNKQ